MDFTELQAEEELEPRGEGRADYRAFKQWHLQNHKRACPADFAPLDRGAERAQTREEMVAAAKSWTVALGGTVES